MTVKERHADRTPAQRPRHLADERFRRARLAVLETELDLHVEASARRPPTPGETARARWLADERARLLTAA